MGTRHQAGKRGEALAASFLEQQGYEVVAQNYRHRKAEIDLIVRRGHWLVFVEVKARTTDAFGHPESFVDMRKANLLMQAAEAYIYAHNWQGHVRFDVVSINLNTGEIRHFEDAVN
jgi:putative endonuclease